MNNIYIIASLTPYLRQMSSMSNLTPTQQDGELGFSNISFYVKLKSGKETSILNKVSGYFSRGSFHAIMVLFIIHISYFYKSYYFIGTIRLWENYIVEFTLWACTIRYINVFSYIVKILKYKKLFSYQEVGVVN